MTCTLRQIGLYTSIVNFTVPTVNSYARAQLPKQTVLSFLNPANGIGMWTSIYNKTNSIVVFSCMFTKTDDYCITVDHTAYISYS